MRRLISLAVLALVFVACAKSNPARQPSASRTPLEPGAQTGACGEDMAYVPSESGGVCVDQYEAALVHVDPSGEQQFWPYNRPIDGTIEGTLRAVPAKGRKPQAYISEIQAESACEASGKRLCTKDEWTTACRGPDSWTYPYGEEYDPEACHEGRRSPVQQLYASIGHLTNELDDPKLDELPKTVEPGGSYPKCKSFYGVYDMHGNLHEWVRDSNPRDRRKGTFMGGFFVDASRNGEGCSYRTIAHYKSYHDYSTGFRCCADPR